MKKGQPEVNIVIRSEKLIHKQMKVRP